MQNAANFIRGSVRLEAVGPYPERFLNILSARGIRFWQVERVDATTVRLTVARSQAGRAQALGKALPVRGAPGGDPGGGA